MFKNSHMCRNDILKAFKAEGGALAMPALLKHTKGKQPENEVRKELKKMKNEGIVKDHKHGDMYTSDKASEPGSSKEAAHCFTSKTKKKKKKGLKKTAQMLRFFNEEVIKLASEQKDSRLTRAGVSGYNQVKRTPGHPTKSHIVVAKSKGQVKTIRFGQQGVKTNQTAGQREAFKNRHRKNIARGPMSAAYWADKAKWSAKNTHDKDNKKWVKGS